MGALKSDPAKRKKLMQSLLHTADLYNPIKPFDVTREWAIRLQTEFNQQCDLSAKKACLCCLSWMAVARQLWPRARRALSASSPSPGGRPLRPPFPSSSPISIPTQTTWKHVSL